MQEQNEEWMPMAKAAKQLKISPTKITRLAQDGRIQTRNKWGDERVRLVSITEVRAYLDRVARGDKG